MSTSNFSDINTPSDLFKANQVVAEETVTDKLMDLILAEDPSVGLDIVRNVLVALRNFHDQGVEMYKEEGNAEAACVWYADAILLDRAAALIKDITL